MISVAERTPEEQAIASRLELARLIEEQAEDDRSDRVPRSRLMVAATRFSDMVGTDDLGDSVAFDPPDPSADVVAAVVATEVIERYLECKKRRFLPYDGAMIKVLGVGLPHWDPSVEMSFIQKRCCPVCGKDGPRRARVCLACCRSPAHVDAELQRKARLTKYTRDSNDPVGLPRGEDVQEQQEVATPPGQGTTFAQAKFAGRERARAAKAAKKAKVTTADLVRIVRPGTNRSMSVRASVVPTYLAVGWVASPMA